MIKSWRLMKISATCRREAGEEAPSCNLQQPWGIGKNTIPSLISEVCINRHRLWETVVFSSDVCHWYEVKVLILYEFPFRGSFRHEFFEAEHSPDQIAMEMNTHKFSIWTSINCHGLENSMYDWPLSATNLDRNLTLLRDSVRFDAWLLRPLLRGTADYAAQLILQGKHALFDIYPLSHS